MAKYMSEITLKRIYENFTETSVHKMLLPFEYAKAFCDFISPAGKLDFAEYFEEDIEFQEIIFEAYGDIDEDDFEDEIDFLKENARKNPDIIMEIFDIFLGDGDATYTCTPYKTAHPKKEVCLLRDLTGKNPDYTAVLL